jgi:metallo-beta-lactamase class B
MLRTCLSLLLAVAGHQALAADPRWSQPREPFRVAGDTWYVGTEGISVLLLRGDAGAILIDGGLAEAAPLVIANLERLGVAPGDVKLLLSSHAHNDHAGGLAALREWSGARVLASADSAVQLAAGGKDDLHFGDSGTYPPVVVDDTLADGETVRLGSLALTAHITPGHTPGSTSWTWSEQHEGQVVQLVYADSITAPGYQLVGHPRRPQLLADFRGTFATLRALRCDLLMTPHPEASDLFSRVSSAAGAPPLINPKGCRAYADRAERALVERLARQQQEAKPAASSNP